MNIFKRKRAREKALADSGRRSFIWKLGAGVSTGLASGAALASGAGRGSEDLSRQVAVLEDEKALRKLHQAFERAIDKGQHEEIIGMFSEDAEVVFNGGLFRNRNQGIRRLYRDRFRSTKTGKRTDAAPGFELAADQQRDEVAVSADRQSATAVFPFSIQVGTLIESESSLIGMARMHGEGVRSWWEGGLYKVTFTREAKVGRWRIGRLVYETLSRADYRPGRTYAGPISQQAFATLYPDDQLGPDALCTS